MDVPDTAMDTTRTIIPTDDRNEFSKENIAKKNDLDKCNSDKTFSRQSHRMDTENRRLESEYSRECRKPH